MFFDLKSYLVGKHGGVYAPPADLPSYLMGKKKAVSIKTLTGKPPLTFVANGQPLVDYTIYGANTRSENLFEYLDDMRDADKWTVSNERYFMYYKLSESQLSRLKDIGTVYGKVFLKSGGTYYYSEVLAITNEIKSYGVSDDERLLQNNGTVLDYSNDFMNWDDAYLCIGYPSTVTSSNKQTLIDAIFDNYDIMLSSVAPTSYIPYWVPGVGDKTANLAPPMSEWVDGFLASYGKIATQSPTRLEKTSPLISISEGAYFYYFVNNPNGFPAGSDGAWITCGYFDADGIFIRRNEEQLTSQAPLYLQTPANTAYIRLTMRTYGEDIDPALNVVSTPGIPPYVPYGYQIPLTINGQTYTIYLDAPLGEGESISLADTGIDIPTVKGKNTLSVDTTVQPENVTIVYKGG